MPNDPMGLRVVRRPRLHLWLSVFVVLFGALFLATSVLDLVRFGDVRAVRIFPVVWWGLATVFGALGLRRAIRARRDPEGQTALIQDRHQRNLSLPPRALARSVRRALAVLVLVPLVGGVVTLATAHDHPDRVLGWFLVGSAVVFAYFGAFVLRSPRLRSAGPGEGPSAAVGD